jgi:hypothetical protein
MSQKEGCVKEQIYTRISLFCVDGILDISLFTNRRKGRRQEEEKKNLYMHKSEKKEGRHKKVVF